MKVSFIAAPYFTDLHVAKIGFELFLRTPFSYSFHTAHAQMGEFCRQMEGAHGYTSHCYLDLLFQPLKLSICWDVVLADSICEVTASTSCILLGIHLEILSWLIEFIRLQPEPSLRRD